MKIVVTSVFAVLFALSPPPVERPQPASMTQASEALAVSTRIAGLPNMMSLRQQSVRMRAGRAMHDSVRLHSQKHR